MPARLRCLARPFGASFIVHRWLFAMAAAYVAICLGLAARAGELGVIRPGMYGRVIPWALGILLCVGLLRGLGRLARRHPARPFRFLAEEARAMLTIERLAAALPVFIVAPPVLSIFTSMKVLIPVLNPYHWDPAFAALDRALHGGMDPWRLLQPVLGHVWLTATLGWCYQAWFFLIFGTWFVLAFGIARPRMRMQYLLTSVLIWSLIGTFAAIALSSGGPVYYDRIVGSPSPFAPLMAYLADVHSVTTLFPYDAQNYLWQNYVSGNTSLGGGISAMPSVHVATTLLFALVLRSYHRVLGWLGFAFLGCIMLGSIHLGWHYAIDGYASVAATLALWRFAGWLTGRMPEFAEAPEAMPVARPVAAAA